jgi:plasmanylethanolamine desaturase
LQRREISITQQDAGELAAGYSRTFRTVEVFSIVSFFSLMVMVVWRVSPFMKISPWLIVASFAVGFIAADFVSGFVHWLADTWGRTDMPVIGKWLLRPFREHHVDQKAITRHDYIETNGSNCMISLPHAVACVLCPLEVGEWMAIELFAIVSSASMIFWVMMTNQFHKWAHMDDVECPRVVQWLQKVHLVLPPTHHKIHHTAPFDRYYSITTGWLNWPLHKLGFYRALERFGTAVFGAIPRQDDIGLSAAIEIAPALPSTEAQIDLTRG